jgi:hypothetical protein
MTTKASGEGEGEMRRGGEGEMRRVARAFVIDFCCLYFRRVWIFAMDRRPAPLGAERNANPL